jgi:hypothetical protein
MKYIVSILMLFVGINTVSAQDTYSSSGRPDHAQKHKKEGGYDPSRLIFGGGFVAGIGTGYSDLGISPVVGYRFTNNFSAGVGLGYEYLKSTITYIDLNSGNYINYPTQANIITPNIWARYIFWRNIFVDGTFEYNILKYSQYYTDNNGYPVSGSYSVNVPSFLLGLGIKQPLGGRVYFFGEILYDVLQNVNSPYYGTVVPRAGILVGF